MLGRVSIAYLNLARIAYEAAYLAEMNHDAKSLDSDLGFFIGFFETGIHDATGNSNP